MGVFVGDDVIDVGHFWSSLSIMIVLEEGADVCALAHGALCNTRATWPWRRKMATYLLLVLLKFEKSEWAPQIETHIFCRSGDFGLT